MTTLLRVEDTKTTQFRSVCEHLWFTGEHTIGLHLQWMVWCFVGRDASQLGWFRTGHVLRLIALQPRLSLLTHPILQSQALACERNHCKALHFHPPYPKDVAPHTILTTLYDRGWPRSFWGSSQAWHERYISVGRVQYSVILWTIKSNQYTVQLKAAVASSYDKHNVKPR